ncbi:restriction endonuclease subunit S [Lachnoanaerobaculum saburreum]|uniref:Type I restriction modification DNA specificity domain protein n=1 Tax=Lachnoanaerobaculum saburreum TaxID=467210 RepID=A0A133ZXM1_9FIRM|nr:restriction endonuclease subunit S [Lachnoanaerobaculum saburreum]KXB60177.1 type I restriction modification DNA specificity domain protein [Lachnoanaerobaculum saburreum]
MDKRWVKFPEVLFFQEGPGVRNTQYTSEGVKLLNVANLVNGKVDISNSDRFISRDEAYGKYKHFLCDNGDFIVASSGIKVEYIDKKMGFIDKSMLPLCMNTSTIRFKVLNSKELNIRYFMYYLKSRHFKLQLAKQITGSAQLNYGPSHLKDMCLPIVDIYIQNNIVEILDKIQNIINIYEAKIEKLDILVRARFVEMFGDPEINPYGYSKAHMGDYITLLTDFSSNGSYKTLDSGVTMYDKPNYAWMVRTTDLETGDMTSIKYIDESAYELLEKSKLFGGEIIMNKIGSAGNVYLMPEINMPASLGRNAFMFRYDDRINTKYLFQLLKSEYGQREIKQYVRGAVTQTITKNDVRAVIIVVPPIELQNKYVDFIEQVNKSKLLAISQPQIHIYKTLTLL